MNVSEMEKALKEKVPQASIQADETGKTGCRFYASVAISEIRDAARVMDGAGFFLESITGLDFTDTLELVYHFNRYESGSRVAVRVMCGQDQTPPSICDIFRGAGWLEREVHEFFGIEFSGNPDMRTLLLPEDADYHPLRKSFGKASAHLKREEIYG